MLAEADREKRQVVLVTTAPLASGEPAPPLAPIRAVDARAAVQALQPKPWPGDRKTALARLKALPLPQGSMTVWIGDGVADGGAAALAAYLAGHGTLRYIAAEPADAPRLLLAEAAPGALAGKEFGVVVRTLPAPQPRPVAVRASSDNGALLARQTATIAARRGCRHGPLGDAQRAAQPGRPHRRSKARNRRAASCWSTSAGAAGRSASPRLRACPVSRC